MKKAIKYLILAIAVVLSFFALKWYYGSKSVEAYNAPLKPVETIKAEEVEIENYLLFKTNAEPKEKITINSYVDGTVLSIAVKEGDKIPYDAVIASVDKEPYLLKARQAEAAAEAAEAAFRRSAALYAKNAVSEQDFDSINAQRDAALAQAELANLELSYTDIKAKGSGTVLAIFPNPGDSVGKSSPVAIIANTDELIAKIKVDEKYYQFFKENKESIEVFVSANKNESSAEIISIAPSIDKGAKNFEVEIKIDDSSLFAPGMSVDVKAVYQKEKGYGIPIEAMLLDESAYYVKDGKAVYVDLSSSAKDSSYVLIPAQLKDEDFIIRGAERILSGESVNARRSDESF